MSPDLMANAVIDGFDSGGSTTSRTSCESYPWTVIDFDSVDGGSVCTVFEDAINFRSRSVTYEIVSNVDLDSCEYAESTESMTTADMGEREVFSESLRGLWSMVISFERFCKPECILVMAFDHTDEVNFVGHVDCAVYFTCYLNCLIALSTSKLMSISWRKSLCIICPGKRCLYFQATYILLVLYTSNDQKSHEVHKYCFGLGWLDTYRYLVCANFSFVQMVLRMLISITCALFRQQLSRRGFKTCRMSIQMMTF